MERGTPEQLLHLLEPTLGASLDRGTPSGWSRGVLLSGVGLKRVLLGSFGSTFEGHRAKSIFTNTPSTAIAAVNVKQRTHCVFNRLTHRVICVVALTLRALNMDSREGIDKHTNKSHITLTAAMAVDREFVNILLAR